MFSVTITSNARGSRTSCIAALSTSMWSSATSGNSRATSVDDAPPELRAHAARSLCRPTSRACGACARARTRSARCARSRSRGRPACRVAVSTPSASRSERFRAEVQPAGQLADDHAVHPAHQLGAQRRAVFEPGERARRAHVRVQPERLAQRRASPLRDAVPAGRRRSPARRPRRTGSRRSRARAPASRPAAACRATRSPRRRPAPRRTCTPAARRAARARRRR